MKRLDSEQRRIVEHWITQGFFPRLHLFGAIMMEFQTKAFLKALIQENNEGTYDDNFDTIVLNEVRRRWIEYLIHEKAK